VVGRASSGTVPQVGFYVGGNFAFSSTTTHIRVLQRIRFAQDGPVDFVRLNPREVMSEDFRRLDGVLVQRDAIPLSLVDRFVNRLKVAKTPLVLELDDALWAIPEESPGATHWRAYTPSLHALVSAARLVLVSTGALARDVQDEAASVVVAPNALPEDLWFGAMEAWTSASGGNAPRSRDGTLELVFMGQQTHDLGLEHLLNAVLEARKSGVDVRLSIIGGKGEDGECVNYLSVPERSIEYPRFIPFFRRIAPQFDVAVVPYEDTPFNRGKSALKYLDYSGARLPGIYNALPQYASVVQPGINGWLCDGSTEGWIEKINQVSQERASLDQVAARAHEDVRANHCLGPHMPHWLGAIREAL
jgi:hypothetical protein